MDIKIASCQKKGVAMTIQSEAPFGVSLHAAHLMAVHMMTKERSRVTLHQNQSERLITCQFINDQHIRLVIADYALHTFELQLRQGCLLSDVAIELVQDADCIIQMPLPQQVATYAVSGPVGALADTPLDLLEAQQLFPEYRTFVSMLQTLSRGDLVPDGETDHYGELQGLLQRYQSAVAA